MIVAGRTRSSRKRFVVAGPPYVPERGFAAAVGAAAAAVAGPGSGSGDRRGPRKKAAAAVDVAVAVGLLHQRLGEWCCGAKFVKSAWKADVQGRQYYRRIGCYCGRCLCYGGAGRRMPHDWTQKICP